jgi:hypothetical protein
VWRWWPVVVPVFLVVVALGIFIIVKFFEFVRSQN